MFVNSRKVFGVKKFGNILMGEKIIKYQQQSLRKKIFLGQVVVYNYSLVFL